MNTRYYLGLLLISALFSQEIISSEEKISESAVPHIRQKRTVPHPPIPNVNNMRIYNPVRVVITANYEPVGHGYAIREFIVVAPADLFHAGMHPRPIMVASHDANHPLRYHAILHRVTHPNFSIHTRFNNVIMLEIQGEINMEVGSAGNALLRRYGNYIDSFIMPHANAIFNARAHG
ncbi:uncharacterized protein LOC117177071 [Belonocnema kinseyi]|uniref:uncharacterized protein LOC117177071 n=1 Tax=Belonocnema kinseyi TaxID=2817044 RepID=UPI00143D4BE1|nr:uncharacterized protein LOC117177071 [Belonocnema kinseyi]